MPVCQLRRSTGHRRPRPVLHHCDVHLYTSAPIGLYLCRRQPRREPCISPPRPPAATFRCQVKCVEPLAFLAGRASNGLTWAWSCRSVPGRENRARYAARNGVLGAYMDPSDFFPLIVRGGPGVAAAFDGGTLTVQFRKARVPAGDPTTYGRMPVGSAAWVDRPLNDAEPFVLRQQMNETDAASVISVLRITERFWKFLCRNTNSGHFEVFRSEPAFMQVKPD
jgi:hypothetical protein